MYLTHLRIFWSKFEESAVINQKFLDIIKSNPIKKLELGIFQIRGTFVDLKILCDILDVINSKSSLEYLNFSTSPQIRETPSENQLANLKHSFTELLKNQALKLNHLYVNIDFGRS